MCLLRVPENFLSAVSGLKGGKHISVYTFQNKAAAFP